MIWAASTSVPIPMLPSSTVQNTYQAVDNLTWTKGAPHSEVWRRVPEGIFRRRSSFSGRAAITSTHPGELSLNRSRCPYSTSAASVPSAIRAISSDLLVRKRHLEIPSEPDLNLGVRYEYTSTPYGWTQQSLNSRGCCSGRDHICVAQSAHQGLHASRRICLVPGNERQHFDSRWFRHGLRRSVRQHRVLCRARRRSVPRSIVPTGLTFCRTGFLANGGIPLEPSTGITS